MIDELKDVKVGDCLVLEITPFIAGGTPKLRIVKVAKRTPKRVWLIGVTGQFDLDGYPAANAYGRLRLGKPGECRRNPSRA